MSPYFVILEEYCIAWVFPLSGTSRDLYCFIPSSLKFLEIWVLVRSLEPLLKFQVLGHCSLYMVVRVHVNVFFWGLEMLQNFFFFFFHRLLNIETQNFVFNFISLACKEKSSLSSMLDPLALLWLLLLILVCVI